MSAMEPRSASRPAPVPTRPDGRRLDASMSLLVQVMERPLDPGYAEAARRRAAGHVPRRTGLAVTALVAALCGLLATVAVVELRRPTSQAAAQREALAKEIDRRTAVADQLQQRNAALRQEISAIQSRSLAISGKSALVAEGDRLGALAGELAVTGPGLEVTVDDAPSVAADAATDPRAATGDDEGRVIDRDLQIVVNGLWASGAEAIAINHQRLGPLSAIRGAGQAILVDYRPLVPPYVVEAIGDPVRLQTGFARTTAGPYLQSLRDNYGIQASFASQTSMDLPAARSTELRYARSAPSPSPSVSIPPSLPPSVPQSVQKGTAP